VQSQYNQGLHYNTPHKYNQGNRGGRGGRVFGGGRGTVVCHKFQNLGHYAIYCPQPPATYMYCHTVDHETKYCPTMLTKIQDKTNHNNHDV
jgi:hypothetical protein